MLSQRGVNKTSRKFFHIDITRMLPKVAGPGVLQIEHPRASIDIGHLAMVSYTACRTRMHSPGEAH